MRQRRIWPRTFLVPMNIDEVCINALDCFRKQAITLHKEYKHICLSLTGGIDSNISAMAFRDIANEIDYFTYYDQRESIRGARTHDDTDYAMDFCKKRHMKFHLLSLENTPSQNILEICKKNTWQRHITRAIDKYIEEFSDDFLHIRSNLLEIVRARGTYLSSQINNNPISYYKYRYDSYDPKTIMPIIQNYWKEIEYDKIYDFNFADIFYWEERCGMWHGCSVLLESDVAFDTYILFNYRKCFENMLSVDNKSLNTNRISELAMRK
jgi:hypothetical protein